MYDYFLTLPDEVSSGTKPKRPPEVTGGIRWNTFGGAGEPGVSPGHPPSELCMLILQYSMRSSLWVLSLPAGVRRLILLQNRYPPMVYVTWSRLCQSLTSSRFTLGLKSDVSDLDLDYSAEVCSAVSSPGEIHTDGGRPAVRFSNSQVIGGPLFDCDFL